MFISGNPTDSGDGEWLIDFFAEYITGSSRLSCMKGHEDVPLVRYVHSK